MLYTIPIYIVVFLYGIVIGSFLNVCIYRIPKGEDIVKINSHCMVCGKQLKWYDLFPVISFLALRGKCRYCGSEGQRTIPALDTHQFGSWSVTKEATAEAEGEESRACAGCGATETRTIAKLPVTDDPVVDDPADDKPAEKNNTTLIIVVAAVAAAGIAVAAVLILKKKKEPPKPPEGKGPFRRYAQAP